MRIEVNNGGYTDIERTAGGISVVHNGSHGYVYMGRNKEIIYGGRENYNDGEIIMALNLLQYMRDNDIKSALVPSGHEDEMRRYLSNLLNNGDLVEFRIFQ